MSKDFSNNQNRNNPQNAQSGSQNRPFGEQKIGGDKGRSQDRNQPGQGNASRNPNQKLDEKRDQR